METLPDIPPDWEPENTPQANVDVTKLGDGYELRRPNGINYIRDQISLSWSTLFKHEYDELRPFLRDRLKLTPFLWTAPGRSKPQKWVCEELSDMQRNGILYGISATFREVMA